MPQTELTDSTVAGNTRSKNPLAAGTLPATWEIYKLSDASTAFATRRPPFVQQKGLLNIEEARRTVALANKQGHLTEHPRIAEFGAHAWDKNDFFWTLDLEGTRWIVKAYGGGPQGGITYRKWLGVREGFSDKPVAFSMKQSEHRREALPPRFVTFSESHKDGKIDTIRVATNVGPPAVEYDDVDVDEIMAAMLGDEPGKLKSASDTIPNDAKSIVQIIDLTETPTSVPKKQLDFFRNSARECRFELSRSKKGKKRQIDNFNCNDSLVENTSENGPKRPCITENCMLPEQTQETDDETDILRLDRRDTQDVVESMERASLDPEVSYKNTAEDGHDLLFKTRVNNSTQHMEAAPIPIASKTYLTLKKGREMSHLYSVTPPPQHPANMSASVVPVSPRPKWLSGRPMGRCRMIAERILADRNRIVRAAGSGCRQCAENLYDCITAPGRKHCAFCTSRGSARNYFCSLATSKAKIGVSFDGIGVPIVQDEDSPSTVVGDQYHSSRHFGPELTFNE